MLFVFIKVYESKELTLRAEFMEKQFQLSNQHLFLCSQTHAKSKNDIIIYSYMHSVLYIFNLSFGEPYSSSSVHDFCRILN